MFSIKKNSMVISKLIGGLGNQMFQYGAGRALSLMTDQILLLDVAGFKKYKLHQGFEINRVFKANVREATDEDVRNVLGWRAGMKTRKLFNRLKIPILSGSSLAIEPHFNYWHELLNQRVESRYLMGYWQSEKYFKEYETQIRSDFTFSNQLEGFNFELASRLNECQSVSLHVRRGDYVTHKATSKILNLCSIEYYNHAISYISKMIPSAIFFIFSDEPEWVYKNLTLPFNREIICNNHGKYSYIDMQLMSLCKHHIISNSTFAWWGAWLNPSKSKVVIAPKKWFMDGRDDSDLLPAEWIRI